MAIIKLQGSHELEEGIYYEFDTASRPLGEGGMGKVYKGRRVDASTNLTQNVAIKFMFDGLPASVIERARREASIQLRNDNLVEMMGFLTTETTDPTTGSTHYHYHVVSELLEGVMLADLLQGIVTDNEGQVIPYAQKLYGMYKERPCAFAVYVMQHVLSGIMALHDKGYIHRDIDPTNIMVTRDEKIKLIDFGIAKKINNLATQDRSLTQTGQFMGKAQYAAPELILGDVPHQNRTTDIYAAGILLFQLITGTLPFTGQTQTVIAAQLNKNIPCKYVPNKQLAKIIQKATQKDQAKRYQSAGEFRVAIDQVPENPDEHHNNRSPIKWVIGGAIAAVLVAIVAIVIVNNSTNKKWDNSPASSFEARYAKACQQMKDPATAQAGFEEITKLSQEPDSVNMPATYLLSRLLYPAKEPTEVDDTIWIMQTCLKGKISQDRKKAHELLKKIVSVDNANYPALFELAKDYFVGPERTGGEAQNIQTAHSFFSQAKAMAQAQQDVAFAEKCQSWINKAITPAPTPTPTTSSSSAAPKKKRTSTTTRRKSGTSNQPSQPKPTPTKARQENSFENDLNRLLR